MTQPFVLQLTDNTTTFNFISSTIQVHNGGFDISLPRAKHSLVMQRPGFYSLVDSVFEYRESKLRFNIAGTTRADVLSTLNQIERLIQSMIRKAKTGVGAKVQLAYAWEGATNITYFEVYAADLALPGDVLSVEKLLTIVDNKVILRDCELSMLVSPYGYGASIFLGDDIDDYVLNVYNEWATTPNNYASITYQRDYLEIDGGQIEGTSPALVKVRIQNTRATPFNSSLLSVYMGLTQEPFLPNADVTFGRKNIFDTTYLASTSWGTPETADTYAENGYYRKKTETGLITVPSAPQLEFAFPTSFSQGLYYVFMYARDQFTTDHGYAIGYFDSRGSITRYIDDFVVPASAGYILPLGSFAYPMTDYQLARIDEVDRYLSLGWWYILNNPSGGTVTLDFLKLLPITHGMRVLHTFYGLSGREGDIVDDGWTGSTYFRDWTAMDGLKYVDSLVYGLLDNLRLTPGQKHRLYFQFVGNAALQYTRTVSTLVKVYAIPTYTTVAL